MSIVTVRKTAIDIEFVGDSQASWGKNKLSIQDVSDKQLNASGKIFQVNGMTIGCAGSLAHIGLLQVYCKTHSPKDANRDDILDWIIGFKDWANIKAKINYTDINVHGIIGINKKVYYFYDFLDVCEIKNFGAVGSGQWLALGAMEVGASAEDAVKVAIKYDLYCGGEITKIII